MVLGGVRDASFWDTLKLGDGFEMGLSWFWNDFWNGFGMGLGWFWNGFGMILRGSKDDSGTSERRSELGLEHITIAMQKDVPSTQPLSHLFTSNTQMIRFAP